MLFDNNRTAIEDNGYQGRPLTATMAGNIDYVKQLIANRQATVSNITTPDYCPNMDAVSS